MFRVTGPDYKVEFTFRHSPNVDRSFCDLSVERSYPDGVKLENVLGDVRKYAKVRPEKEVGRRFALTAALRQANLPKHVRAEVWERYFNRDIPNNLYAELLESSQVPVKPYDSPREWT